MQNMVISCRKRIYQILEPFEDLRGLLNATNTANRIAKRTDVINDEEKARDVHS